MAVVGAGCTFKGSVPVYSRSLVRTSKPTVRELEAYCHVGYELNACIVMTPKELLAEVQAKVSVLAGIRLSDLHEEDTRGEGGGGDPDGEWHFIGLKGAGLIVSAYYVELKEHKSKAYATNGMGGNVTAKAKKGHWSIAISWYKPFIGYPFAHYEYSIA